jgi:hypothetical protein
MAPVEIEIRCSDGKEHRQRLEARSTGISGLRPVAWDQVITREYETWNREHFIFDTNRPNGSPIPRTDLEAATANDETIEGEPSSSSCLNSQDPASSLKLRTSVFLEP